MNTSLKLIGMNWKHLLALFLKVNVSIIQILVFLKVFPLEGIYLVLQLLAGTYCFKNHLKNIKDKSMELFNSFLDKKESK